MLFHRLLYIEIKILYVGKQAEKLPSLEVTRGQLTSLATQKASIYAVLLCCVTKWSGLRTASETFLRKKGFWHQVSQKFAIVKIPNLERENSIHCCGMVCL